MLSEERGLLITPRFWQLPRGNAAFCSGGRTPQLTYWMLNIDSYYECCQTQRAVLADPEWRVVRNSISECQVRNQRPAGLFRDKIYRFYKMRKGSSTSEDGNGHGRMRLSLPWCGPLERCLTRVTTEGNAKQGEAQDKDSGSFGPGGGQTGEWTHVCAGGLQLLTKPSAGRGQCWPLSQTKMTSDKMQLVILLTPSTGRISCFWIFVIWINFRIKYNHSILITWKASIKSVPS